MVQYPGGARSAYLALSPPGWSHNSVVQSIKKIFYVNLMVGNEIVDGRVFFWLTHSTD